MTRKLTKAKIKILLEFEAICRSQPITDKEKAYQMTLPEFIRVFGLEAIKATRFNTAYHNFRKISWQHFLSEAWIQSIRDAMDNNEMDIPLRNIAYIRPTFEGNYLKKKKLQQYLKLIGLTSWKLSKMSDEELETFDRQKTKMLC